MKITIFQKVYKPVDPQEAIGYYDGELWNKNSGNRGDGNMSGQIRMSPAELTDKAKRYGRSGDQIEQILEDLRSLQEDLRGQWEGQAFNRFDDQFVELSPKVLHFADLMRQIEKQLTTTADAMAQQDQELSRNFGLN